MKAKTFNYKGYTFTPIGNILGGFAEKSRHLDYKNKLAVNGYEWKDFYKVAKQNHASCDIFECQGKLYMPCSGAIVGLIDSSSIKKLEEYERWYH